MQNLHDPERPAVTAKKSSCFRNWKRIFTDYRVWLRLITVEPILFLMAAGSDMANTSQSPGLYWKICKINTKDHPEIDCLHLKSFSKHKGKKETESHMKNVSLLHNDWSNSGKKSSKHSSGKHGRKNKTLGLNETVSLSLTSQTNITHSSNNSHHGKNLENIVQEEAADVGMYIHLASVVPLIIAAPLYGAFADKHGRKINILIGITGLILSKFMYVIQLTFVELSLNMLIISQYFIAFTGVQGNIYANCYGYISDRTTDKHLLTKKFMILHVVTDVAKIVTSYSTGGILEKTFFTVPIVGGMAIASLAFFYALFGTVQKSPKETQQSRKLQATGVIPKNDKPLGSHILESWKKKTETAPKKEKNPNGKLADWSFEALGSHMLSLLKSCVHCLIKKREGHFRAYLWVTVGAFFLLYIASVGMHTVFHLFEQHTPLAWSGSEMAYYKGYTEVVNLVGTLFTILVLQRLHFHETTILLISISSTIIRFVLIGFATDSTMMYVAGIFGFTAGLTQPVSKSLVCQFVDIDEVGKVYVLFALAMDFAVILSHTTMNQLYKATLTIHQGFVFFFVSGILALTVAALLWIHIDYKRYRAAKLAEKNGQKISTIA